jgi:hypothetical protein
MDCHLIAIEVCIESGAHQRMNLDGVAIDENGLECLDAETVEGRSTVEQYRAFFYYSLKYVIYLRLSSLYLPSSALDVVGKPLRNQMPHNKGLKQF